MTATLETTPVEAAAPDHTESTPRRAPRSGLVALIAMHGLAGAILVGGSTIGEVIRSLAVVAITVAILAAERRGRTLLSNAAFLVFGLAGLMAGLGIGIQHAIVVPGSMHSIFGVASIISGLAMVVIGTRRLLRPLRSWRKLVAVPVGIVMLVFAVLPIGLTIFIANAPDYPLGDETPADFGLEYREVTVTTADDVDLAGWYIPSSNGAALVQLGGCCAAHDDELEYAVVLARHGYGVLMLDQRGHGGSEGHGTLWGWWGEVDVAAGVDFLVAQPDVIDARIGAIGMSVGGEQVIAAAGSDSRIRAVVAEGVTARGARDEGDSASGAGGVFIGYIDWLTKNSAALMTSADKPTQLRDAIKAMTPDQHVLVINAGTSSVEIAAAETFEAADPAIVTTWIARDATHIDAYGAYPEEWESRVTSFLADALSVGQAG